MKRNVITKEETEGNSMFILSFWTSPFVPSTCVSLPWGGWAPLGHLLPPPLAGFPCYGRRGAPACHVSSSSVISWGRLGRVRPCRRSPGSGAPRGDNPREAHGGKNWRPSFIFFLTFSLLLFCWHYSLPCLCVTPRRHVLSSRQWLFLL